MKLITEAQDTTVAGEGEEAQIITIPVTPIVVDQ